MKLNLFVSIFSIFFICSISEAHNEDVPGPHGGKIQMPANFHTELVKGKNNVVEIYLLDLQMTNPTVKNSSLSATVKNGKLKTDLSCRVKNDHYSCIAKDLSSGTLHLHAIRDGTPALTDAVYPLPLK